MWRDTMTKRGLNEKEAAEYLGMAVNSLRQARCQTSRDEGKRLSPPFCKINRKIVYLRDDLDRFLEEHRVA
ncbi:helix-turn-helix domain-containing protein [Oryzomonas sagensis]|uniref:Helix-turn-helix domain-containing protein n=2 Tax=Oryzomonas sagensis TaxID=2603857 RepID=A0ABQ6TLD4_9BACT|nr:helix-turn-helix domain-containing protein [Oryzomonas sagensis]